MATATGVDLQSPAGVGEMQMCQDLGSILVGADARRSFTAWRLIAWIHHRRNDCAALGAWCLPPALSNAAAVRAVRSADCVHETPPF